MSAQRHELPRKTPLVALLEDRFASDPLHDFLDLEGEPLPERLFETALRAPLREFLSRPGKELRARLVSFAFDIARASSPTSSVGELPSELPQLVELVHAGSLIVDDIEDGSNVRRGQPALHRLYGMPISLNAGNWLYFEGQALLSRVHASPTVQLAMHRFTIDALLRCHYGQALDLSVRVTDLAPSEVPAVVRAVTQLKTGSLLELACTLGALAGGASPPIEQALRQFGRDLGVGLQMLDDLGSVMSPRKRHKGAEDLFELRPTWPWAWLSRDLSELDYEGLRNLANIFSIRPDSCEPLLERMRAALGASSRATPRLHLRRTLESLRNAVGSRPEIAALEEEIHILEKSYE
jgi:geranylgeranyl pyrophosphate synthase